MRKDGCKLKKIEIRGYKSIAFDIPLELSLGDINILLGSNGSGKSNIISFFKMLGYMMSGNLQLFVEQGGTNQKFLYYGSKRTPTLYGELHFESSHSYDITNSSLLMPYQTDLLLVPKKLNGETKKKM